MVENNKLFENKHIQKYNRFTDKVEELQQLALHKSLGKSIVRYKKGKENESTLFSKVTLLIFQLNENDSNVKVTGLKLINKNEQIQRNTTFLPNSKISSHPQFPHLSFTPPPHFGVTTSSFSIYSVPPSPSSCSLSTCHVHPSLHSIPLLQPLHLPSLHNPGLPFSCLSLPPTVGNWLMQLWKRSRFKSVFWTYNLHQLAEIPCSN